MILGVIYKKEDKLIAATTQKVIQELKAEGHKINLARAKLVLTFGGDGTILRAARLLAKRGIPILGVHLGGIGFLTEIELAEVKKAVKEIEKGNFTIDERIMLEAQVGNRRIIALNDLVLSKSGIARVIKFELKNIASYTADGLILATPTGSTAYNLAAGGPLLSPQAENIIATAICPHDLSNRSLVLNEPVTLVLNRGNDVILTADGQQMISIKPGQEVVVKKSKLKTKFIRLKEYNFFRRVRETFGFGRKS